MAGGRPSDQPTSRRTSASYLAEPGSAARAVVVVLHSWWGLTPSVARLCDDLAARGYLAAAPDLYGGDVARTEAEAAALRSRRRRTPMWRHILGVLAEARELSGAGAVGQVGFSMGGHWAWWLARQPRPEIPTIAATSVFYAVRAGDFTASRSAFQLHLAERDPFVSAAAVARLERQLQAAGRPLDVHSYPGTGHWFVDEDRPDAYRPAAARQAWARTVAFLDRHLPAASA